MSQALYVRAVAAWTRSTAHTPAWLLPHAHPPGALPAAALLSVRGRGRASLLTRMFAEVIEQVSAGEGVVRSQLPMIFGSGNGEMQVTSVLLQMMNEADGALSPARFQASVHNTAAGQLSMACENRGFATSLAGGTATVAVCLEEAAAYLAVHGGEILVAVADEAAPDFLADIAPCEPLALAVRLSATPSPQGKHLRLQLTAAGEAATPSALPELLPNPCAAGLPLWAALLAGEPARVSLTDRFACIAHVSVEGAA